MLNIIDPYSIEPYRIAAQGALWVGPYGMSHIHMGRATWGAGPNVPVQQQDRGIMG